jgi:hypothetical protein
MYTALIGERIWGNNIKTLDTLTFHNSEKLLAHMQFLFGSSDNDIEHYMCYPPSTKNEIALANGKIMRIYLDKDLNYYGKYLHA